MPVSNIIDERSNQFDVNCMAVFESSWHDNSIIDATQFEVICQSKDIMYIGIEETTIEKAIKYGNTFSQQLTLYIYDIGVNNYADYSHIDENGIAIKS